MCGDSMMNAWKRENVILGGWVLYISILYRILSSMGKQPRHGWKHGLLWTSDVWAPCETHSLLHHGRDTLTANGLQAGRGLRQVSWITHTNEVYNLSINDK